MKDYLWTFVVIWGSWFVAMVATSIYADVSPDGDAAYAPYLVWFLGIPVCGVVTVVAFLAIAGAHCLEAPEQRTSNREL